LRLLRFAFRPLSGRLRRVKFLAQLDPRHGAAIVAGLFLALSFPKAGVAGLAWLAPGLMLFAALGRRGRECFRIGYVAGLAHYLVTLYWLLFIPFPAGAVVGWLALSAYLALYPAAWVWLCWRMFPGKRFVVEQSWWASAKELFAANGWQRAWWTVLCAALWVASEMVVARFLSGFPWSLLGVSQHSIVLLIQIASVAGVYGVSFLVVWSSVSLALAMLRVVRQPGLRWGWLLELRLTLIVLMGVMIFGGHRLRQRAETDRELKVALVQPSIPQLLIWDHSQDADRFKRIVELSRLALAAKPDLLIWPESSMPSFTEDNFRAITNLIAAHKVWMIFGADDVQRRAGATGPGDVDCFNAAFLFDPDGRFVATYRKRHLVVFGEYLPLARALPFLRRIIPVPGDFTPGDRAGSFELSEPRARLSPLICFEDVIPGLTRRSAGDDTDLLLNLTNDGWFGQSAAQWQQAANAVFRAVENGLPLVRCTNNGLTCWIDSRGRLQQVLRSEAGSVYAAGFMIAKIPLLPAGEKREPTFYHRHGDWFGWGCVIVSVIAIVRSFLPKDACQDMAV
jgi:apolipoprotein N-acyltransferase